MRETSDKQASTKEDVIARIKSSAARRKQQEDSEGARRQREKAERLGTVKKLVETASFLRR